MNELKIKELNSDNLDKLRSYSKKKNQSKDTSKAELLEQIEALKLKNAELFKQNESLEKGQEVLLQQIEYFRNDLNSEIRQIKQNMTLLLNPPKEEKKSLFERLFKS